MLFMSFTNSFKTETEKCCIVVFRLLLVLLRFFVFSDSHYLFSYGTVW